MGGTPPNISHILTKSHGVYGAASITLGRGPKKIELVLPTDCDPDDLLLPRNLRGEPHPDIVPGFKACLGVPRHPSVDGDFILKAMRQVAYRHWSLLELVADVSEEHPFAALRLLRVCGVSRFVHILVAVQPESASLFA
jgi:hypothetical protein